MERIKKEIIGRFLLIELIDQKCLDSINATYEAYYLKPNPIKKVNISEEIEFKFYKRMMETKLGFERHDERE